MERRKYTGVSLLYYYRHRGKLFLVQKSFITGARSLKALKGIIEKFIGAPDKYIRAYGCNYLGVCDVFEICGPLREGAFLGFSTLWSYKVSESAERLLKPSSQYWVRRVNSKPGQRFLVEMVFLLGAPAKYDDRRTIVCNVLIDSENRIELIRRSTQIGKSDEIREKLYEVLLQYEPHLTNGLRFIGLANIKPVYGTIRVGKCFEALYRNVVNLSSAKKLVRPLDKFMYYEF